MNSYESNIIKVIFLFILCLLGSIINFWVMITIFIDISNKRTANATLNIYQKNQIQNNQSPNPSPNPNLNLLNNNIKVNVIPKNDKNHKINEAKMVHLSPNRNVNEYANRNRVNYNKNKSHYFVLLQLFVADFLLCFFNGIAFCYKLWYIYLSNITNDNSSSSNSSSSSTVDAENDDYANLTICEFQAVCGILFACLSIILLFIIAYDRYVTIVQNRQLSKLQIRVYTFLAWSVSLGLGFGLLSSQLSIVETPSHAFCSTEWENRSVANILYSCVCLTILLVSLVFTTSFYYKIHQVTVASAARVRATMTRQHINLNFNNTTSHRSPANFNTAAGFGNSGSHGNDRRNSLILNSNFDRSLQQPSNNDNNNNNNNKSGNVITVPKTPNGTSKNNIAYRMFTLIIFFIVGWSTYCSMIFYNIITGDTVTSEYDYAATFLSFANSMLNPIVYIILNRKKLKFEKCCSCFGRYCHCDQKNLGKGELRFHCNCKFNFICTCFNKSSPIFPLPGNLENKIENQKRDSPLSPSSPTNDDHRENHNNNDNNNNHNTNININMQGANSNNNFTNKFVEAKRELDLKLPHEFLVEEIKNESKNFNPNLKLNLQYQQILSTSQSQFPAPSASPSPSPSESQSLSLELNNFNGSTHDNHTLQIQIHHQSGHQFQHMIPDNIYGDELNIASPSI